MPMERSRNPELVGQRDGARERRRGPRSPSVGATTISPRTFKFNSRARAHQAAHLARVRPVALGPRP